MGKIGRKVRTVLLQSFYDKTLVISSVNQTLALHCGDSSSVTTSVSDRYFPFSPRRLASYEHFRQS